jgi:hypothetical protein
MKKFCNKIKTKKYKSNKRGNKSNKRGNKRRTKRIYKMRGG